MESAQLPSGSRVGCAEGRVLSPPGLRDADSKAHRGDDLWLSCPSQPRPESPSQKPSVQGFRPPLHRVRQNCLPGTGAEAMTHLCCPGLSQTLHAPPKAAAVDASVRGRGPEQRAPETLCATAHVCHTRPNSGSKVNRVQWATSRQAPPPGPEMHAAHCSSRTGNGRPRGRGRTPPLPSSRAEDISRGYS